MAKERDQELLTSLGRNIRRIRRAQDMTQENLADSANLSQVQIVRIEQGKINTSVLSLFYIAKALNCSIDELFDGK